MGSMKICYSLKNGFISGVKETEIEKFKNWFKKNRGTVRVVVCLVEGKCFTYSRGEWRSFKEEDIFYYLVEDCENWNHKYKD